LSKPRKIRMAIQNLSYCGGCEVAISDLGESLLSLLDEKVDLVYAPLFMSAKDYENVDVLLFTGCIRNELELEEVKKARKQSKYLVSFGSCASFGGVPGLANLYEKEEILENSYDSKKSVKDLESSGEVPKLVKTVKPIDEYVKVDFLLPGCPPPPPMIREFLVKLMNKVKIEED
jgi:F420-non-reducing hydrogenase small subunit